MILMLDSWSDKKAIWISQLWKMTMGVGISDILLEEAIIWDNPVQINQ